MTDSPGTRSTVYARLLALDPDREYTLTELDRIGTPEAQALATQARILAGFIPKQARIPVEETRPAKKAARKTARPVGVVTFQPPL